MVNTSRAHLGVCPTGARHHGASVVHVAGVSGTSRSHAVVQNMRVSWTMLHGSIRNIPQDRGQRGNTARIGGIGGPLPSLLHGKSSRAKVRSPAEECLQA